MTDITDMAPFKRVGYVKLTVLGYGNWRLIPKGEASQMLLWLQLISHLKEGK